MFPNWFGVFSAALAWIAFFVVHRVTIELPAGSRLQCSVAALVGAIPGASFSTFYAHLLPESGWYYEFRSLAGTELLIVFIGVAGGCLAALLPRNVSLLPLLGVAAFSIAPIIKPFIGPIPEGVLEDVWDGDVCLQSTPSTCGAASTATVLRHFGVVVTESELAAAAHSYAGGTEAWYLARAAGSRGFHVRFKLTGGFSPEEGLPAVVGVRLGAVGHFVAIVGKEGDRYIVDDPLRGGELLSREALQTRYHFTGFHMLIQPRDN